MGDPQKPDIGINDLFKYTGEPAAICDERGNILNSNLLFDEKVEGHQSIFFPWLKEKIAARGANSDTWVGQFKDAQSTILWKVHIQPINEQVYWVRIEAWKEDNLLQNLRRLSRTVKQSGTAVLILNTYGEVNWSNNEFTQQFALDNVSLFGKRISEILGLSGDDKLLNKISDSESRNESLIFEWKHNNKWYSVNVSPALDDKAALIQTILMFQNVTERKLIELDLQRSEISLRAAQRMAKMGSFEYNVTDNEMVWTPELLEIMGRTKNEFESLGQYSEVIVSDNKEEVLQGFRNTIESGEPLDMTYQIEKSDGSIAFIKGRASREERDGKFYLLGTSQDITELELAKKEAVEALERAQESARIKQEFLANMSHEIRTPMNSIIGFSRLLLRSDKLNSELEEYAQSIYDSSEKLLLVLDEVINVARLENQELSLEPESFNLHDTMKNLFSYYLQKAGEKGLQFINTGLESLPRYVYADRVRIYQILQHLLDNSIKFTEEGVIRIDCRLLGAQNDKSFIEFEVTDTGIGIRDSDKDLIFEAFTQVDSSSTRRYEGIGAGLSIVRHLIQLLEGKLEVESEIHEGTSIKVRIPVKSVGENPESEPFVNDYFSGKKALIVEDNRNNRLLANRLLHELGLDIKEAQNGMEALGLIRQYEFDIILMDIQMPILDGVEATKLIRKLPDKRSETPIIALTAHVLNDEVSRYLEVGMNSLIRKPIKRRELLSELRRFLSSQSGAGSSVKGVKQKEQDSGKLVNLDSLRELSKGDESFILEMITVFFEDIPAYVSEMRNALDNMDILELSKLAHKLKSPLNIIGVSALDRELEQLENLDKSEKNDTEARELTLKVLKGVELVSKKLEEERRTLSS